MDLGVLLSLPVESIATRAVLVTLACVALVRLLLRLGLRSSRARVATALAPGTALVAVVLLTGTHLQLPELMLPVDATTALPVPVRDGYVHFAPAAVPLLVGVWGLVAGFRVFRHVVALRRAARMAEQARLRGAPPGRYAVIARRVAARMGIETPVVAVVPSCPGGAYVVGVRRPVVVLSTALVDELDDAELEGVLAHELAHVRRRDNLVATVLTTLRDLAFFVPGGGWALRQLHRERELAADQLAVSVTGKPGALAGGLLKVLETASVRDQACAALAPSGGLVDRVRVLVEAQPTPSAWRHRSEMAAVALVTASATLAALVVTTAVAGPNHQRDAVALVWSPTPTSPVAADAVPSGQARVFDVYRRTSLGVDRIPMSGGGQLDEHSQEYRRGVLRACGAQDATCPVPDRSLGLGLRPRPTITVDDDLTRRWEAIPVVGAETAEGFGVYWLARSGQPGVGETAAG